MSKQEGVYILGISCNGKRFRPSDWVERIATSFGYFDEHHRLQYNPKVTPVKHQGQVCLFVACSLAVNDPDAYHFIIGFATSNHLQIKHSRDNKQLQGELREVA
jgi:hypothetical protein